MKKLTNLLKESKFTPQLGKVYSNPMATSFVKENEEDREVTVKLSDEQKAAFFEAVKQYKTYSESVYRNAGLEEAYESIKNVVEVASRVTLSETGDWFDNVTVGRHMKRMGESFKVFEKTLKEVSTLQQRLESSYDEIGEVLNKYYEINESEEEIEEGNEFGASRAKAIAAGNDSFEVDGKTYPVKDVDNDDKENAKEFSNESMKLTDMIKGKLVNESPSSEEIRIAMLAVNKQKKYRSVPPSQAVTDVQNALDVIDSNIKKGKIKDESLNENKYSIIDPNGNAAGTGTKDQVNRKAKQLGGNKKGYFVVPAHRAKEARRAMERFKFDFKNPKLQDKMSGFYFDDEMYGESVNEGKKRFYQQDRVGSAKYTISYHDGKSKHKDGSDFYGIQILKNKKELEKFRSELLKKGYREDSGFKKESVNEDKFAGWIAGYNGKKIEIKKGEAKDLYNAKLLAIAKLKVPKSKVGLMFIKPAVDESVVNEAKYDIGMARKGNGLTIYNKAEEENGDYKNVAHISDNGVVKYFDKKIPSNIKKMIEKEAQKMKESVNEGNSMIKLKNLLNESFGFGELPSSKLMKMKVSAKDMLASVGKTKVNEVSEEDVVEEGSASAKSLLQSVIKGESSRIEGIKLSKKAAEGFLDWLTYSPYGKKFSNLPFYMLLKASFNWGLGRHLDTNSKEYKDLQTVAKTLEKK